MAEDDIFESDELYMDEEESSFVEDKDDADNSRDEKVGTVVGLVEGNTTRLKRLDTVMSYDGLELIKTIVVFTDQTYSLLLQRSLKYL
jgi:hypothetical protein